MTGLRKAEVDYRHPASGAIVATASIDDEPAYGRNNGIIPAVDGA